MKIPFVGPSYEARSLNASAQRTVNCYLEFNEANPADPVALYGTPGLTLRATLASGANRGCIASSGYWYFVAGSHVYRLATDYTVSDLGAIGTSTGRVGLATNGTEVLIVDGVAGWLATGASLAQIVDVDFPNGVTQATCQDGYFIVTGDNSAKIYWNEVPNTGAGWNGLDFASAEGSPDVTKACISDRRELWLFGAESAEVWVNTGDSDQLFQRSGNAFVEQGCASAWTVAAIDNTVYWLGSSKNGQGIVFRAEGYSSVRISNHALETAIAGYSTIADAYAYTYQMQGHAFYVLTFPTANATWFYDAATRQWFEWVWRDPADNTENRHRSVCCAFNGTKHLVGDWESGKVYSLEMDVYTDNEDPILRLRRAQTFSEDGAKITFESLTLDMETGVGTATGQGSDPQVMLRYSNDGGRTWSNYKQKSIGAQGQYGSRVKFGPTGSGRDRVWEVSMTDPCKFALFGASARIVKGD